MDEVKYLVLTNSFSEDIQSILMRFYGVVVPLKEWETILTALLCESVEDADKYFDSSVFEVAHAIPMIPYDRSESIDYGAARLFETLRRYLFTDAKKTVAAAFDAVTLRCMGYPALINKLLFFERYCPGLLSLETLRKIILNKRLSKTARWLAISALSGAGEYSLFAYFVPPEEVIRYCEYIGESRLAALNILADREDADTLFMRLLKKITVKDFKSRYKGHLPSISGGLKRLISEPQSNILGVLYKDFKEYTPKMQKLIKETLKELKSDNVVSQDGKAVIFPDNGFPRVFESEEQGFLANIILS